MHSSFHASLFLAIRCNSELENALNQCPKEKIALFINEKEHYLCRVEWKQRQFIGKRLKNGLTTSAVALTKEHICSILKKLIPQFPFSLLEFCILYLE